MNMNNGCYQGNVHMCMSRHEFLTVTLDSASDYWAISDCWVIAYLMFGLSG